MMNRREAMYTLMGTVLAGLGLPGSDVAAEQDGALQSIRYGLDGRKVGGDVVIWARNQVTYLSHLDDRLGGKHLYPVAQSNLNLLQNLLQARAASGEDERELRLAIAHTASQAGWFAEDAELLNQAAQHYHFGIEMARSAANNDFAAYCLMRLGDLASTQGNPGQALSYLGAAEAEAGLGAPLRSLILSFAVEAQGMQGEYETARKTLARADAFYEQCDTDRIPDWLYWMTRPSLTDQAPRAFISHDPRFAAQLFEDGLAHTPADFLRDRMFFLVMLAKSKHAAGEIDEAVNSAVEVLQTVSIAPMPAIEKHLLTFSKQLPDDPIVNDFKERFEAHKNSKRLM